MRDYLISHGRFNYDSTETIVVFLTCSPGKLQPEGKRGL